MADKIFYKVVFLFCTQKNPEGKMFSSGKIYAPGFRFIEYKRGQWAFPRIKGSRLFVFGSRCAAEKFAAGYQDYRIYKCRVKDVKKQTTALRLLDIHWDSDAQLEERITAFWEGEFVSSARPLPSSIYSVSAVKIFGDPFVPKHPKWRHRP